MYMGVYCMRTYKLGIPFTLVTDLALPQYKEVSHYFFLTITHAVTAVILVGKRGAPFTGHTLLIFSYDNGKNSNKKAVDAIVHALLLH